MNSNGVRIAAVLGAVLVTALLTAPAAMATPVCTDDYMGGPPRDLCGGRVFPEAVGSVDYVRYLPDESGFMEFQHGIEYLAELYPRWVSVIKLSDLYGEDAVSAGADRIFPYDEADTGDGYDIFVVKVTDHEVPDEGKQTLLFSLSVHGDERGGQEGGVRAIEDLAVAAEDGGTISDGVEGYESTTGVEPEIHEYEVADVLAQEAVYFVDFNVDGWVTGEVNDPAGGAPFYTRGNYRGTDLNRQMPTVGRINPSRNPLTESEMLYGHKFMHEVADQGVDGLMAYAADVHGESQSRAWADIMYPAGQFNSVKHRQLMAIAERTKSVMDDTLFLGLVDLGEEATGGDAGEGIEDHGGPRNTVMTKPARWGTVWDTLGYTDTGFIGDYMASELGVTGMDYEIALNHSDTGRSYGRPWSIVLQENYINATRAIIKTAMAYALYQEDEFPEFSVDPGGRVGYLYNPEIVTDADENGAGRLPGPGADGFGQNGEPVTQQPYAATNMRFFEEESEFVVGGFERTLPADVATDPAYLDRLDTLVLADIVAPEDAEGRDYDPSALLANLRAWVERGGNLVLTDRGLHALEGMGVVADGAVSDIRVYQPYANFVDRSHALAQGLRGNARQLSEATLTGYGIGSNQSPMSIVATSAWEEAGGHVVGTTGNGSASSDGGTQTSIGEVALGEGRIRIMGGGLGMPNEDEQDHRYGLKDYSLTYSGLYVLENAIVHDAPGLGVGGLGELVPAPAGSSSAATDLVPLLILAPVPLVRLVLRRRRE